MFGDGTGTEDGCASFTSGDVAGLTGGCSADGALVALRVTTGAVLVSPIVIIGEFVLAPFVSACARIGLIEAQPSHRTRIKKEGKLRPYKNVKKVISISFIIIYKQNISQFGKQIQCRNQLCKTGKRFR